MDNICAKTEKLCIGGVIVTYYPEASQFLKVFEAAVKQVDFLVIVNNSDVLIQSDLLKTTSQIISKKVEVIENGQNLGVAVGLNIGLKALIGKGCSHFFMLDQDSLIPDNMVLTLLKSLQVLNQQGHHVAAIGPAYFHIHLNKFAPFIKFGKFSLQKIQIENNSRLFEAHFLITSGSLVTLEAIQNIGFMEDELFIDLVDTEWCLRALDKHYKLYGHCGVVMSHSLGDKPVKIFGRKFIMHTPLRHYYLVRNSIHLLKKSYIPLNWRFIVFVMTLRSFMLYCFIAPNRIEHLRKMLRGFKDGLNGKLGRYN